MSVVGFDLGNFTSYIAIARQGGIEVLTNEYSLHATPSCVAFGPQSRCMGVAARQQANTNVKNTIFNVKQLIGRKFSDPISKHFLEWIACDTVQSSDDSIGIMVNYRGEKRVFTPEQITAMMLVKLKEITQAGVKELARVPFYYTDVQRQALLCAIKLAGLNSLRIVNETTAIALAYGIYKHDLPESSSPPKHVVFVDVGHSACQAALVALHRDKLVVLNQVYDFGCSGMLFDAAIREHFRKIFIDEKKVDAKSTPRSWLRLLDECEKLKKMMSANSNPLQLNVECLMGDLDVTGTMQRSEFEVLIEPQLESLRKMLINLLSSVGLKAEDVDEVEIVGGSSRVPAVKKVIADVFRKDPKTTMNQDEAVARGAAMMCAIMSPVFRVKEFSVKEAYPYQIKLSWEENNIFEERDEFPFSKMINLYRDKPFKLFAEYGSREIPHSVRQIGTWLVRNPPNYDWNGKKQIKVKVRVTRDGVFSVCSAAAYDEVEVKGGEVMELYTAAGEPMETDAPKESNNEMQASDRREKEKADAKNSLEEYIYYMRDKLSGDFSNFIDADSFRQQLTQSEDWLYSDGEDAEKQAYEEKLAVLKKVGDPVQERHREFEKRGAAFDNFDRLLLRTRKAYDAYCKGDPQYSHLDSKDMEKVINAYEEKKKWLDEQRGKQERRPLTEAPIIFRATILQKFDSIVTPILNKPKPTPPPPKEEKKDTGGEKKNGKDGKETNAANTAGTEQSQPQPAPADNNASMEVD
ncbi:unnamed protein product [Enterobius vermicularis]|uniref:Heat shock 70 kDa protein 4L n=1 Tax=Enterobius vermicularis TaxID=51028 RepID=A0A0N4UXG4_ENTVE|nr:unnamed protein product [Enterobius vermicularis]